MYLMFIMLKLFLHELFRIIPSTDKVKAEKVTLSLELKNKVPVKEIVGGIKAASW